VATEALAFIAAWDNKDLGLSGGLSESSNASEAALGLFLLSFPPAVKIPGRKDLDFRENGYPEVDLGVLAIGEEMGEKYEERWGDAPSNPMMEGSRW